jgi:hypothetical protein
MGLFNSAQGLNNSIGAVQSAFGVLGSANSVVNNLSSALSSAGSLRDIDLPAAGELTGDIMSAVASFGGGDAPSNDWRCRLSLPLWPSFRKSAVLAPLKDAGGLIFPYTPTISMNQQTSYTPIGTTHNNYAFNAYKNSDPGTITITAPMYCEDATQALYWIAALHYLRSASKMFSGNDPKAGNPPPIVHFNAYGNYVFKNVPVVITGVTCQLPNDVDYISCNVVGSAAGAVAGLADTLGGLTDAFGIGNKDGLSEIFGGVGQIAGLLGTFGIGGTISGGLTHVPTKSSFTVTLKTAYSRQSVKKFSLDQFVTGGYMNNSTGFI